MAFLEDLLLVALFSFLGASVKYIDDFFDRKIGDEQTTVALVALSSVIATLLIATDPHSATILLGILVGVLIAFKVDNIAFWSASAFVGSISVALYLFRVLRFDPATVVLLAASAWADEPLNDFADANPKKAWSKILRLRPTLKLAAVALAGLGVMPGAHAIAIWGFDIAYDAVATRNN